MERFLFVIGGLSGALAVALGAFAAHELKSRLSADQIATFQTGVQYQMYHALALVLAAAALRTLSGSVLVTLAGWLFLVGTVLFSGSLYLLVLTRTRAWGAVTPLGGVALIAGWLCLASAAIVR